MAQNKFKMVIIKSSGTVHLLSGIAGPILTPFPCSVDKILQLIRTNINVYEVLSDGTEVKLTLDNFNKINEKNHVEEKVNKETKLDNTTVSKPEDSKSETKKEIKEEKSSQEEKKEDNKDHGAKSEGSDNSKNKSNPSDKYKNSNNNRK